MKKIKLNSYAKINLSLNITGTLDNLHTLDMVLATVDLCDTIVIKRRKDNAVNIRYVTQKNKELQIDKELDTSLKAYNAFKDKFLIGEECVTENLVQNIGVDIFVKKRIPFSAGLGGSSVDAAGVLVGLKKLFNVESDISSIALSVGSDVPYLLGGGFARVTGVGEKIEKISTPITFFGVICKPEGGVNSTKAYQEFDKIFLEKQFSPSDNDALVAHLEKGDLQRSFADVDNALTTASIKLNPSIKKVLGLLAEFPEVVRAYSMTGSGSGCVAFLSSYKEALKFKKILKAKDSSLEIIPFKTQ